MILGAFGLSYALFEIPMGLLGDKLGVRWVLQPAGSGLVAVPGADRRGVES